MAGQSIGPRGEPTTIVLLKGHSIKSVPIPQISASLKTPEKLLFAVDGD